MTTDQTLYAVLRYLYVVVWMLEGPSTTSAIYSHVHASRDDIDAALTNLLHRGLASLGRGEYRLSEEGRELYESLTRATRQNNVVTNDEYDGRKLNTTEFRDEALSGLTQNGKKSPINRAALPMIEDIRSGIIEPALEIAMQYRKIADQLNISTTEVHMGLASGEIRWCGGCKRWGKFHQHKSRPNGWQQYCVNCRKHKVKR